MEKNNERRKEMKQFNNLEEMKPYLNEETETYEFSENGERLDIEITFDLSIDGDIIASNITAKNINAADITARDIDARDIDARDIDASNIKAGDIDAADITARDIDARDIDAWNIKAGDISSCSIIASNIKAGDITAFDIEASNIKARDIDAWNIRARNIEARNIEARDINATNAIIARDISFYAVCYAYENIFCRSITGRREDNSKYFALDGKVFIDKELEPWPNVSILYSIKEGVIIKAITENEQTSMTLRWS
jgi:hypothetical protein